MVLAEPQPRSPSPARRLSPRTAGLAAGVGGLLWVAYGPLTMLQPWGPDVAYEEGRGYSLVLDARLFVGYSLPGALAVALSAAALLSLPQLHPEPPRARRVVAATRTARALGWVALVLGLAALVGVAMLLDPVFTAGRIFGTLALSAGLVCAAVGGGTHRGRERAGHLLLLGALGAFLLPVWPLVHALGWLSEAAGAVLIAGFGAGWLAVAWWLWRDAARRPRSPAPGPA